MNRIRVAFYRLVVVISMAYWGAISSIYLSSSGSDPSGLVFLGALYAFGLGLAWAISAILPK